MRLLRSLLPLLGACLALAVVAGCKHNVEPVRYHVRLLGTRHLLPTGQPICLWGYRISKEDGLPPNARVGQLVPRRAVLSEVECRKIDYLVDEHPVASPFRTGPFDDKVVIWRETGPRPGLRSLEPTYIDVWFFGPADDHTGTLGVVVDLAHGPHVEWTQVLEVTTVQPVSR